MRRGRDARATGLLEAFGAVVLRGLRVPDRSGGGYKGGMHCTGLVGLLILILDIYVVMIVLRGRADFGMKLLWIILVLVLPLVGPILFFLVGPGRRRV